MFQWLASTWSYFNQVLSLWTSPMSGFSSAGWTSLVNLLMSLLTNPFFYAIIGIILVMSLLPKFEE